MTALALPSRGFWLPRFEPWRLLRPLKLEGQFSPGQRMQFEGAGDVEMHSGAVVSVGGIDFVGSAKDFTTSSSDTLTLPGTPAENDIVIAVLACDTLLSSAGITTSGYTTISNSGTNPGRHIAWKRLGATPDTTIAYDKGTRNTAIGCHVWRGVDTVTALDAATTSATGGTGLPNAPSITTVTDGAVVVAVGVLDDDDETTGSVPSGYENGVFQNANGGSGTTASLYIASKLLASAGAENPAVFGGSGNDEWAAWTIALRPA